MKKHILPSIIKIMALTLAVAVLFSACSSVKVKSFKKDSFAVVNSEYSGDEFHKTGTDGYTSVGKSGLIELLFHEKTKTVAVKEANSGILWSTLPDLGETRRLSYSAAEVTLSNGDGNIYVLNTQDNSVNYGNAESSVGDGSVSVTYRVSADKETGALPLAELAENSVRVDFTVTYYLSDGSFYVNLSMNNLSLPEGVYLEKISLLNGFGAYSDSQPEDFIFVPDGSGAMIMTGKAGASDFAPLTLSVYGADAATEAVSAPSSCLLGAYGVKRSNGAFLCIIEQGDAIADIKAVTASENDRNRAWAEFNVTDINEEAGKKVTRTVGNRCKNDIRLCFRFLSGKSASYSGMATACRENLIRNSTLSTKSVEVTEKNLPFMVSLQGGYIGEKGKYNVLSSYEQALTVMTLLKAKGVNNACLRYNGLYPNGNNGYSGGFDNFKGSLGADEQFKALYSYISSHKFSMLIDCDLLTSVYDRSESGKGVNGKRLASPKNPSAPYPAPTDRQGFLRLGLLEDRIEDILSDSKDMGFDGYALNDAGAYLYSDYSSNFYERETAKKEIAAQLPVLASSKLLLVDRGNIYSVKNADVIGDIPITTAALEESEVYKGIPFIQLLLHGITEYCAAGYNSFQDPAKAFLKSVEYGCLPSVSWYCSTLNEESDAKYKYDKSINEAVSFWVKANSAMADLRSAKITQHYEVQQGVYCTEYNNSVKIYVNYTDKGVTVSGITVPPVDFVRV